MGYSSERLKPGERPVRLELEGRSFDFVLVQRGFQSVVYKSADAYLRIGEPKRVLADLTLHKKMEAAGFPVAKVFAEGSLDGQAYFIETSLGEKHFGDLFADDIEKTGLISEATFENFLSFVEQFANAQLATKSIEKNFDEFARGICLGELCQDLPQYTSKLRARFEQAQKRLAALPFVVTHGDFNAHNIYPAGVIDLEDSFYGAYGYDLISGIAHIDNFPDSQEYEYFAKYRFTTEQKQRYMARLDMISEQAGLPALSDFETDFDFCRAVWSATKISHVPKLQKFRHDRLVQKFLE